MAKTQPSTPDAYPVLEALEALLTETPVEALGPLVGAVERLLCDAKARPLLEAARLLREAEAARRGALVPIPEAASALGCSQWNVYDLIRRGRLPGVRVGGGGHALRVRQADLDQFIRDRIAPA
jgi:excisionase family DNA binding protein